MVPHGNNTFELIVVVRSPTHIKITVTKLRLQANPFGIPGVINTQVNGVDAFATSDLFTPHPTKAGFWRPYGRADDQIIHSTSEKVCLVF